MQKILLYLILLSLPIIGFAQQEFAPIGAKWYYNHTGGIGWNAYFIIESVGDTTILEKDCKLLEVSSHIANYTNNTFTSSIGDSLYLYQESHQVYQFIHDDFFLLYDFNPNVGDSWEVPVTFENYAILYCYSNDTITTQLTVDSLSSMILNGDTLQTIYTSNSVENPFLGYNICNSYYQEIIPTPIIPNIGSTYFLLPSAYRCEELFSDIEHINYLRCYEDNNQILHFTTTQCDSLPPLMTSANHLVSSSIEIYPNPSSDFLYIDLPIAQEAEVLLFDIQGHLWYQSKLLSTSHRIEVSDFPKGFYWVEIRWGERVERLKMLVI